MSQTKHQIQYQHLYSQTSNLKSEITSYLSDLENKNTNLKGQIGEMDGQANLIAIENTTKAQARAQAEADVSKSILEFMHISGEKIESEEKVLKSTYTLGEAVKSASVKKQGRANAQTNNPTKTGGST